MYQVHPHRPLSVEPPNPRRRFLRYWAKAKPDDTTIRLLFDRWAKLARRQDYDYPNACISCGKPGVQPRLRRQYIGSCYLCAVCFDKGWRLRRFVMGGNYSPTNIEIFNNALHETINVADALLEQA